MGTARRVDSRPHGVCKLIYSPNGMTPAQIAAAIDNKTFESMPGVMTPDQVVANVMANIAAGTIYQGTPTAMNIDFNGIPLTQLGIGQSGAPVGQALLGSGYANPGMTVGGLPITIDQQNAAYNELANSQTAGIGKIFLEAVAVAAIAYGGFLAYGALTAGAGAGVAVAAPSVIDTTGLITAGSLTGTEFAPVALDASAIAAQTAATQAGILASTDASIAASGAAVAADVATPLTLSASDAASLASSVSSLPGASAATTAASTPISSSSLPGAPSIGSAAQAGGLLNKLLGSNVTGALTNSSVLAPSATVSGTPWAYILGAVALVLFMGKKK